MEVYLLRHGIAEEGRAGQPDADRALTPEGKKKLQDVLRLARGAGVNPSLILTSPYRRAVETAEVAKAVLGYKGRILRTRALQPLTGPEGLWEELRIHKDEGQVLLAGHEPMLGRLAGYLLGSPELNLDFKKGALVRVDLAQFGARPAGVLKWMVAPRLATAVL